MSYAFWTFSLQNHELNEPLLFLTTQPQAFCYNSKRKDHLDSLLLLTLSPSKKYMFWIQPTSTYGVKGLWQVQERQQ
jgi:hypothetical protein